MDNHPVATWQVQGTDFAGRPRSAVLTVNQRECTLRVPAGESITFDRHGVAHLRGVLAEASGEMRGMP